MAEGRVAGEVQDRPGATVLRVSDRVHEDLDLGFDQGAHAHGARLVGREDGDLRQPMPVQLVGGGLDGAQDGMGGGVVGDDSAVVLASDHGVVKDGHGADGSLSLCCSPPRFGDRFGHEQLVVHRTPSLAEGSRRTAVSFGPMPAWTRLDTALLVLVTAVAAAIRLWGLGTPDQLVFDEIFYAQNACLLAATPDVCGIAAPVSAAHPPLGQWLIAAGIAIFGYDPFGWRVASAVAGATPWR